VKSKISREKTITIAMAYGVFATVAGFDLAYIVQEGAGGGYFSALMKPN
jgi:hypothetical protein